MLRVMQLIRTDSGFELSSSWLRRQRVFHLAGCRAGRRRLFLPHSLAHFNTPLCPYLAVLGPASSRLKTASANKTPQPGLGQKTSLWTESPGFSFSACAKGSGLQRCRPLPAQTLAPLSSVTGLRGGMGGREEAARGIAY